MGESPQIGRRWLDFVVAALLFFVSASLVVATNDMGFVRDEAFYFRHSETYQSWFVEVEAGGQRRQTALESNNIDSTWKHNNEHPPLGKVLFGYSWRLFGRKLRPVASVLRNSPEEGLPDRVEVRGLGAAHGFGEGSLVAVLSPQIVGSTAAVGKRRIASGVVSKRTPTHATVRLDKGVDLEAMLATCQPAGPAEGLIRRTGCEAYELRSTYFLSESSAMRFPGALFAALIVLALYLAARGWVVRSWRLRQPFALLVALGYLALPRPFYHAHLCTFDTMITALMLVTTLSYQRSLRSATWVWITALMWGLCLLTKHNALFLPVAFIVHWLWDGLMEGRIGHGRIALARVAVAILVLVISSALIHPLLGAALALLIVTAVNKQMSLPGIPAAYFAMLPVGILMLAIGWPLMWVDTLDNLLRWIEFHLTHEHYMQHYFGEVLAYPPFPITMPWVMTALTWTLPLLVAFVIGVGAMLAATIERWRWRWINRDEQQEVASEAVEGAGQGAAQRRSFERLLLISALWPVVLISLPETPVFGGVKHWFLSFVFMLFIVGHGVQWLWTVLCQRLRQGARHGQRAALAASWLLALLVLVPSAQATWEAHPHGTAYYNELIGGLPGAADRGMQRQFWGGATRHGLEEVNKRAVRAARIWFHKSPWGAYVMYQREGWLRRDLSYAVHPEGSQLGLYHHQKDHDDYELECFDDYGVTAAVSQVRVQGVPMLSVYERPQ